MKCSQAETFIHAYVDGELQGVDRDAYERHIFSCDSCFRACRLQARFKASLRGHLPRPEVPQALRARLESQLAAAPPPKRSWPQKLHPKVAPAFAVAAALVVLVVNAREGQSPLLAQALSTYQAGMRMPMPMDVAGTDCAVIAKWFRERIGFPVKPPPLTQRGDCEGGRIVNVKDRFAAYFLVRMNDGQTLGWLVVDTDERLDGPVTFRLNDVDVSVASNHGISGMAFRNRDGLTHVVTGEVEPERLKTFLPAAYAH